MRRPRPQGAFMRTSWYPLAALAIGLSTAASATAPDEGSGKYVETHPSMPVKAPSGLTLDEVYGKYIEARGGAAKLGALKSVRFTGKGMFGPDGRFQAEWALLLQRPGMVREEVTLQGLSAVDAWDGKEGWRV